MSILNVEHLSHGFGDRAIFEDVSFRLLKGEHIGLVGANGEGKSTFMNQSYNLIMNFLIFRTRRECRTVSVLSGRLGE